MQMLNRYFTPFALALIAMAVYFRTDAFDSDGLSIPLTAIGILVADLAINWWMGRNQYRWVAGRARASARCKIWLNYVWAAVLFYLLYPYWSPMWLLLVVAPSPRLPSRRAGWKPFSAR